MNDKRRTNHKRDFTQVAFDVLQQAIGEVEKPKPLIGRKANSSKGGKLGGVARARNLSNERRSEIASIAAKKRWKDDT